MNQTAEAFNQGMAAWKENQVAPWGRLRYTIMLANLAPHLGQAPQRILDMGGGNGAESILLAQQSHEVTLVDFSREMLAEAQTTIIDLALVEQIKLHQADVIELPTLFAPASFDAILFHNVLQYVPDPHAALQAIHHVLHPDGFFSLSIINPHSEVLATALREFDLETALAQVDSKEKQQNIFGLDHPLYELTDLHQMLANTDFAVEALYGVRCLNDYISDNERKSDPIFFAQLEALELAVRDKYPYYLLARFYHLIARKE